MFQNAQPQRNSPPIPLLRCRPLLALSTTGAVGNANAGESCHKILKGSRAGASMRTGDNEVHIMKNWNDSQGLKALADGVTWKTSGFVDGEEVQKDVTAGPLCQETLQALFAFLPQQMNPASAEDDTIAGQVGRPHGYQQWEAGLKGVDGFMELQAWQEKVAALLPSPDGLDERYADYFGCGRVHGEAVCSTRTCSYCWRNRGHGLTNRAVVVFNHWGGAPGEASAGTGTIRGCPVKDADTRSGWTRSTASQGSDVEIYLTINDQREGNRGLGCTTLGKVAFFFEHQANPWRRDEAGVIPEGEYTIWMAVSEYVTAGVGNSSAVHRATGLAEFKMRQALSFYPASAVRRAVHMMHACPTSGESACGLVREGERTHWQCKLLGTSTYLLNKYFHGVGRDSVD